MTLNEYLKTIFADDLKKMNFLSVPDECLKCLSLTTSDNGMCDKGIDAYTLYFGCQEWENMNQDIKYINKENLEYFFICLFTIITIDTGIYTYYKRYYHQFRKKTMYPKFGGYSSGFGISPYYVNPKKILEVPESFGLLNIDNVSRYCDEYINIFINECSNFFINNGIRIKTNDFINNLLNDKEFKIGINENNSVFTVIYSKLKERINKELL
jgi:hypothetical protein